MAFYPVRKQHASHPETMTSPAAKRHFDDVVPMPDLVWAYEITPSGYTAEVSLPMHDHRTLGLGSGAPVGFDVSVGFANEAGTQPSRARTGPGSKNRSSSTGPARPHCCRLPGARWYSTRRRENKDALNDTPGDR